MLRDIKFIVKWSLMVINFNKVIFKVFFVILMINFIMYGICGLFYVFMCR